jgi:hypothetical protein
MNAKEYAENLAWFFLKNRNFAALKKMPNGGISGMAQGTSSDFLYQTELLEFGGLPVESVGYEVKEDETVGDNI